ncbi:hypothetical protein chiPu_0019017 [Chiloscyllium punctatum]|uniref:Uncharacterized protein n=1 Tax=Chiloscyllium punctatum TaxID=137246 RepID=A0A401RQH0_CHIPU|nr:hypothetical protein [Chiloscyllium punctatum]
MEIFSALPLFGVPVANVWLQMRPADGVIREGCSPLLVYICYSGDVVIGEETSSRPEVSYRIQHLNDTADGLYNCSIYNALGSAVRSPVAMVKTEGEDDLQGMWGSRC